MDKYDVDVVIIGAGPAGMQAAINLASSGVPVAIIDPEPGLPEAPEGVVTIPARSHVFGTGPCGQPANVDDWLPLAEGPLHDMLMAGRRTMGKMHFSQVIGYNFTRRVFWGLMLDAAKACGASVIKGMVTRANRDADGVMVYLDGGRELRSKGVILATGIRSGVDVAMGLGIGTPDRVHGIFTDFPFDGEWANPELGFLFNLDLVPRGYFWVGYARKNKRVSVGIMNEERHASHDLIYRFARTGIIPELKDIPDGLPIQEGVLGAMSHVRGGGWPIAITAPRVISIGEASGMIACYIYEGLFAARYEGMVAATVFKRVHDSDSWSDYAKIKQYESEVKVLDDYILHITREQHYAMYHSGTNGQVALEAYLKGFNQNHPVIVDAMRTQYLEFSNMSRFELGLFGAILSHVPFMDKIPVTASLVTARLQH